MKKDILIPFLMPVITSALFFACKSGKTDIHPLSLENIENEFFEIKAGKDTAFTTRKGVVIEVPAQTFYCKEPIGAVR